MANQPPSNQLTVPMHNDGGTDYYPAISVKVYSYIDRDTVMDRFDCESEIADRAIIWAFENGQRRFWEDVEVFTDEIFSLALSVHSVGRSGGWLIVDGLDDPSDWSDATFAEWDKFVARCRAHIRLLTSESFILEEIESNRWAEEDAEQFNFMDNPDNSGEVVCLADVPRCAHCREKR